MLAYAAHSTRRDTARPKLLIPIVAGHLAVIAIVMTARMQLPPHSAPPPLIIHNIPIDPPPPPPNPEPNNVEIKRPATAQTTVEKLVDIPPGPEVTATLTPRTVGNFQDGSGVVPTIDPPLIPELPHQFVRTGPKLATAEERLRPPYPAAKRDAGEEATLTLKLTIDDHGRVIAVEPVGRADPAFLASARAHLLRTWRFEPATEDGRPVASVKTITLHFELGDG